MGKIIGLDSLDQKIIFLSWCKAFGKEKEPE